MARTPSRGPDRGHGAPRRAGENPLVGRAAELSAIERSIADVQGARAGSVLLLAGEPGIGKTRLMHEAVTAAGDAGFVVVDMVGLQLDSDLAFGSIVSGLGQVVRALDARELATLRGDIPDLPRLFPDLGDRALAPVADPGLERSRVVVAVVQTLTWLARRTPIVLAVDDLHWVDPATLQVLSGVARVLDEVPVLMIATVRDAEPDQRADVATLIDELRRLGLLEEIRPARLDPAEVVALSRAVLGGDLPQALVALLDERAGGVPLYVLSLVHALRGEGHLAPTALGWALLPGAELTLPAEARQVVAARTATLDEVSSNVLCLLATHDGDVPVDVLRTVSGHDEDGLERAIASLVAAGLAKEHAAQAQASLAVTHPLVAEAVRSSLGVSRRQRLHAELAHALLARPGSDQRRLARHVAGAGALVPAADALPVLEAAAETADRLGAPAEVARYTRAILDRLDARHPDRVALLLRYADAATRSGAPAEARTVLADLVAPGAEADRTARARAHLMLAELAYGEAASDELAAQLSAADQLASGEGSSVEVLVRALQVQVAERSGDAAAVHDAVVALGAVAQRTRSPIAAVHHKVALARDALLRGSFMAAWQAGDDARVLASEVDDPMLSLAVHDALALVVTELPDPAAIRTAMRPAVDLARRMGVLQSEMRARGTLFVAEMNAGAFSDADAELAEGLALARRGGLNRGLARLLAMRALLLVFRGRLPEAHRAMDVARAEVDALGDDELVRGTLVLPEAWLALAEHRVEDALAWAAALSQPGALVQRRLALLGDVHLAAGDRGAAIDAASRIREVGEGHAAAEAVADRVEGAALLLPRVGAGDGDRDRGLLMLRRAVSALAGIGARLDEGTAALALADAEADTAALTTLFARFEAFGAGMWSEQARVLLRAHGARPAPPRPTATTDVPLSARELEVARLVGEGLTNAQIADRLVLSRHTVGSHLQRIYGRMEVSSRSALTRRLADLDLL